jgi:DNA-binding response OmpR family regulator
MGSKGRVLVVEDDAAIRRGLVDALRFAGFDVVESGDGREGLQTALAASELDLVLLDVVLPSLSGFEILTSLRRARPALPIVMVTARGAESDRVQGLRDGADDYVVKPFSARELLARVEAVLRRSPGRPVPHERLAFAGGSVDFARREVRLDGGATRQLSEKEVQLLSYLAGAPEKVVSREELLERVWGLDPRGLETRTVDMHVARLREKMAPGSGTTDGAAKAVTNDEVIVTVRGQGYMLGPAVRNVA